jgi:hypothetical protein
MPKDGWYTASRAYQNACRRGVNDGEPREWRRRKRRRKATGPKHRPPPDGPVYVIPAGTECHVRLLGTKPWMAHTTKTKVEAWEYTWRNATHHGFACLGWELKVRNHQFRGPKK